MNDIHTIIEHVEKSCKERGKPLTEKRKLILRAMVHANKPLSAYDLVDYCKEHFAENIQAMSVYRILHFLESEHFIHKIQLANKFIVCSHILCEQTHGIPQFLICSQCNKVSEHIIAPDMMAELQSRAKREGFTIISPQIEINCVCDECKKKM